MEQDLAPFFSHQLVHLFSDNSAAVSLFQAGQWHDPFLHGHGIFG